jgi:hypothetical protein
MTSELPLTNDESVMTANVNAIMAAINAIQPGALLWVDLGISPRD